ncbi:MAG: four-carbon acid sugar kinase family protein [Thermoguttaceae bacterium]
MNTLGIAKEDLFAALPPEWPEPLLPAIRAHLAAHPAKVVVLDDDPTGTQTVHDIPVLTEWSEAALHAELQQAGPGFFLLTNTRAFPVEEACRINREIGERLSRVAAELRQDFVVVSRGDSTLRGHFPDEVEALGASLAAGRARPPILLCPHFEAGGRHTIGDVHYVADGDRLVPAAETPFARDAVFGYRSSNLREWVVEKSRGRYGADQVTSLALADIRTLGPQGIAPQLLLAEGTVCIANAAGERDLEVIVLAALLAEARGARTIYRTAASFVATRMGLAPRPLLAGCELAATGGAGGLVVVGSHVPKSTEQLGRLLADARIAPVELAVNNVLDATTARTAVPDAVRSVNAHLAAGRDTVLFTSRPLVTGAGVAENLGIGQRVSSALVQIVARLEVRPRYLVAKGGITSSDLATRGLGVRRARVRGQLLPGVPVWQLGPETKFPGLPYVVFPGNVGGPEALQHVVQQLKT